MKCGPITARRRACPSGAWSGLFQRGLTQRALLRHPSAPPAMPEMDDLNPMGEKGALSHHYNFPPIPSAKPAMRSRSAAKSARRPRRAGPDPGFPPRSFLT